MCKQGRFFFWQRIDCRRFFNEKLFSLSKFTQRYSKLLFWQFYRQENLMKNKNFSGSILMNFLVDFFHSNLYFFLSRQGFFSIVTILYATHSMNKVWDTYRSCSDRFRVSVVRTLYKQKKNILKKKNHLK